MPLQDAGVIHFLHLHQTYSSSGQCMQVSVYVSIMGRYPTLYKHRHRHMQTNCSLHCHHIIHPIRFTPAFPWQPHGSLHQARPNISMATTWLPIRLAPAFLSHALNTNYNTIAICTVDKKTAEAPIAEAPIAEALTAKTVVGTVLLSTAFAATSTSSYKCANHGQ